MKRFLFLLAILVVTFAALLMRLPCLIGKLPDGPRQQVLSVLGFPSKQVPAGWAIDARPMHTDEAVHADKFGDLLERNKYKYDPYEYHGPALNYFTLLPAWLGGQKTYEQIDELTLRIVPLAFGVGLVLLLVLVGDGLGRWPAIAAGILLAVSHAFVFYSRYYIMEILLVFFAFLALAAGWRYARTRSPWWAGVLGGSLGLMFATKETWVISAAAMAGSLGLTLLWRRAFPADDAAEAGADRAPARPAVPPPTPAGNQSLAIGNDPNVLEELDDPAANRRKARQAKFSDPPQQRWLWHGLVGLVAFTIVWAAFFSSFGTNWSGLVDSFLAYKTYFNRAGQSDYHLHPWPFYWEMLLYFRDTPKGPLVWSEGLILGLALVGLVAALSGRLIGRANPWFLRFLALYGLSLALAYTVISYKTPWCLLVFLHPLILLAGLGAAAIFRLFRPAGHRVGLGTALAWAVLLALLGLGVYNLAWQAARGTYRFFADPRNPYVYAHSVPNVIRLGKRIHELAALHPDGRKMPIKIIPPTLWPLPWYIRGLDNVRYSEAPPPTLKQAAVVVALADIEPSLDARLHDYQKDYYGLRPNVMLHLYVRNDLWQKFLDQVAARTGAVTQPFLAAPATRPVSGAVEPREEKPQARMPELPSRPGMPELPATAPATRPASQPASPHAVIVGSANWKPGAEVHRFTHTAMATDFEVIVLGGSPEAARRAADAAFDEVDYVENELSRFVPGSDIWRINNAEAGKPITVGIPTMECLQVAQQVNKDSGGVFDVTIGSLLACWRNPDRTPRTPAAEELAKAKARTGMHLLALDFDRQTVTVLAAGVQVDLGGIGKGFAVDRMAAVLKDRDVKAALVHGGRSSVLAIGSPPDRKGWDLAFREIPGSKLELPPLLLTDRSVSGSAQGKNPHIIDPHTGRLVTGRLGAWSAAPTATESDALSTAFLMMTPPQIEDYCAKRPHVSAIIAVHADGKDRLITFGKW